MVPGRWEERRQEQSRDACVSVFKNKIPTIASYFSYSKEIKTYYRV